MAEGSRSELDALLASSDVFGTLDEGVRDRLARTMTRMAVTAGETLLRQGEVSEALFMVVVGRFEVRLLRDGDHEAVIDSIGPGGTIGEMQLVVGGPASATVVAAGEAEVLRLPRRDFDEFCRDAPELLEAVARVATRRVQFRQMLEVLPSVLGPLDDGVVAAIKRQAEFLTLRSGEVLFHQGDQGDAWYVVTSGRLAVVDPAAAGQPDQLLAEVGRGHAIGELALLTGEPRSATVYALRDAELVRFPMNQFAELLETVPQALDTVLRTLARRLVGRGGGPRQTEASGLTIALVPATPGVPIAALGDRIAAALSRFGPTIQMSSARLAASGLDPATAHRPDSHPAWVRLGAWLEDQGASHRFLLLVADPEPNGWNTWVVGLADHLILAADAHGDPRPGALEQALPPPTAGRRQPRRLLALLYRDGSHPPGGTAAWIDARAVNAHIHIRLDRPDDVDRLARSLAGRGVALALSGGGARCFAQLGVVRAMREQGIPIDLVTGTSAGAMSGFLVATDRSDGEMRRAALLFHRARPFAGYTLPLFSLKGGQRLSRALREQCGETQLEDLWIPFVAVSSNLTRKSIELHTRGSAWAALRASSALPGILEPQIRDGEVLVDGGLIDNLPVRVARDRIAGRVIAVDVSSAQPLSLASGSYPSPWRELLARVGRRRDRRPPPGLLQVLLHSMLLASLTTVEQTRLEADLCLRPELDGFGVQSLAMHEKIIDAGYHHALIHLPEFAPADGAGW